MPLGALCCCAPAGLRRCPDRGLCVRAQGTEVPAGAATASSFGELAALVEQPDGPDVIYVTQGLAWQAANEGRGVRVSRSVSIVGACMDDNSPLPGAVAGTCTFDASWQSRFFELDGFASGVSASVAFTRIGFAKGKYLGRGGAVYVSQQQGSHKVEFTDCVFADCEANHGGAVYALGGQALDQGVVALAFLRCRLQENLAFAPADQMGAGWGGAVMARNAAVRLTFEECAFADNTATFRGGAVYVWLNAHASFKRCAFRRNRAVCAGPSCDGQSADALTWMGGAIVVDIATVSIDSTPFVENAALHGSNIHLFGPAEDKQATVNILASPSAWGDNASQGATTTFKPGAITLWGDFAFVTALALPPPPPPLPPPASSSPQLPAATASVPLPAQDDGNGSGFFDRDPAMVYLVLAAILAFALSAILATRQLLLKLRSGAQGNGTAETTGVELLPLPPRGTASLQGVQVQADGRQEAGPSRARGEVGANGGEVQAPITERFATDESTTANTEGTVSLGAMRMSIPGGAQNDASDSKSNSDASKGTSGKGGAEHAAGPEPIEDRLASWMVSDPDLPDAPGPRLGNGSFATVFHVTWNSEVCALKVIEYHQNLAEPRQPYILSRLTSAERRREAARNELMVAKILAGETCSNLVHTLASRRHTSQSGIVQQALVQEYCEGQSLGHCLRSGSMYGDLLHSASLQQLRQLRLCRQIANGLIFRTSTLARAHSPLWGPKQNKIKRTASTRKGFGPIVNRT